MFVLMNCEDNKVLGVFKNESDAFELLMSKIEELYWETACFYYLGLERSIKESNRNAKRTIYEYIETMLIEEVPFYD